MKKIQILLSTYNGEKYLEQQLDSLLQQIHLDIEILVRDDGSTDETLKILNRYRAHKNIKVMSERNIGVVKSFLNLISISSDTADYFAFCDQDDFWESDKLLRAVESLEEIPADVPAMYCSQAELVNENLEGIGRMPQLTHAPSFANALVQNIATGCTVVFNHAAKQVLLRRLPNSSNIIMHDWWVYLVVSAFGNVIYDPEPRILYRQHSSNSIGAKSSFIHKWVARLRQFINRGNRLFITKQVEEFRDIYGSMLSPDYTTMLENFIDGRKTVTGRIRYALSGEAYRQSALDNIIFRILIVLNRI
ncbi:glycosyltransferase family 2 protein [Aneurinibacillus tyrosinisolvens]|uniref:glycosyltransferase family 2 protein n=1 Tax=Aneurinibacillus tyrosinisolvens TaxID=1443435 RepID=UPI00063F4A40|nr:glycosyltransferase family 2 protein [Aneurinibacillus tyrosinisolvens]